MNLGLFGSRVVVIGGSKGIGAAAARELAAEGAQVALVARTAPSALAEELGGIALAGDALDAGSLGAAIGAAHEAFGGLDAAVVSIGAAQGGLFWELGEDTWREALELKFLGMVRAFSALAPLMQAQGSGRIVAVVGSLGLQPSARLLPGSCANAACLALVRGASEELLPHGVTVKAVNPGPTRTDRWTTMIANLAAKDGRPLAEVEAERLAAMGVSRLAEAQEVGRLIAVLASPVGDLVSGGALAVDVGAGKGIG